MSSTLLIDDKDTFVEFLQQQATNWDIPDVMFCRDPDNGYEEFLAKRPRRIIADNTFEGSREDGIGLLERIRLVDNRVELILLTGNEITPLMEKRLAAINARGIAKGEVDSELMEVLLSGSELPEKTTLQTNVDVAELKLRFEEVQLRLRSVTDTNIMLVSDIIVELTKAAGNGEAGITIEGRHYTPGELTAEVLGHTPIGKQLVDNHHRMFHLLREG